MAHPLYLLCDQVAELGINEKYDKSAKCRSQWKDEDQPIAEGKPTFRPHVSTEKDPIGNDEHIETAYCDAFVKLRAMDIAGKCFWRRGGLFGFGNEMGDCQAEENKNSRPLNKCIYTWIGFEKMNEFYGDEGI